MQCYEGKENYIFISYAHKDSDRVLPVIKALNDASFRVWYDAGIEAGSEWPENVAEHLCGSAVTLIFLSKNALESHNCVREIHFAISEKKDILVIYLEDVQLTAGMRMQLGPLQALFRNRYATEKEFLKALLTAKIVKPCKKKDAANVSAKKATSAPAKKATSAPAKKKTVAEQAFPSITTLQLRSLQSYQPAPDEYFDCSETIPTVNEEEVEQTKAIILETLEEFKIPDAKIVSVTFGTTVTCYNVSIARNVSPRKVIRLDGDFAIRLRVNSVNVYPNYEDAVICIEIPNKKREYVRFGNMLSGLKALSKKAGSLPFPLGKDVKGNKLYGDITKMVHLLVAGSSGTGKSVFLHSLMLSLVLTHSPEELRFILIDPKRVEFIDYQKLPHLLLDEIITDPNKAAQSLNWAIDEMNRRYQLLEDMSRTGNYVVNVDQYNEQVEPSQRLPKIVIIVDELADLMLTSKKTVEDRIQCLTQKSRAAGIHLILATQRPSVEVITGVIKANLPTRIAFFMPTEVDSRIVLDQSGAQKLLGKGDFLYTAPGTNLPIRVQSPCIFSDELRKAIDFIVENNPVEATPVTYPDKDSAAARTLIQTDEELDPLYVEALRFILSGGQPSISIFQRKFNLGFNRAGKIIEWMEEQGYISPFDGANPRKVLITKEEFEEKYGDL